MSEIKEIPSCCMNCDMFRVFDGEIRPQCAITETYIDDYLDKRAPNCPLGIVTCKDCKHWNKKTEYCKHWSDTIGQTEDAYYTVNTGADFYCEYAERKNK